MHLRRIKLYGFKSFADRTELELNPRLIAIVGPNGCGKSNIVDAVLWALGEHNPRVLRAANAADVVFSGSAKRKGVGYAEVQLVFDNEDDGLPFPAAEVAVTRRIALNGESDYAVNGKSCRQKDVTDLFADTGLGRTGYAIIGQHELDAVLTAQPEQRRLLVDEAAGVQRFRARKADALKRLEAAAQHLRRAQDLVDELERQAPPLEEQAAAARLYREARGRLDQLELGLALRELRQLTEQLEAVDEQIAALAEETRKLDRSAAEREREADQWSRAIVEADKDLDLRRNLQQAAFTGLERAESAVALADERIRSLTALLGAEEQRAVASRAEADMLAAELATVAERLSEVRAALAELSDADEAAKVEQARAELAAKRAELSNCRDRIRECERAEMRFREDVARIARMRDELGETYQQARAAEAPLPDLNERCEAARARVAAAEQALAECKADAKRVREEQAAASGEAQRLEREIAALDARAVALAAATREPGADALEKAFPDLDRLARRLMVAPEHRTAIDAALGAFQDILVAGAAPAVREALQVLADGESGRAAIIARDSVRAGEVLPSATEGALVASSLVRAPKEDEAVVEALLGRVYVVRDLAAAEAVASRATGWWRVVTETGEVLDSSGAFELGHSRGRVSIEGEVHELTERVATLRSGAEGAQATIADLAGQAAAVDVREQEVASERAAAVDEARRYEGEVLSARQRVEFLTGRVGTLEERVFAQQEALVTPPEEEIEDAAGLERDVAVLERRVAAMEAAEAHGTRERQAAERQVREEAGRAERLQARLNSAKAQDESSRKRVAEFRKELADTGAERAKADLERRSVGDERQKTELDFEDARVRRAALLEQSFGAAEELKAFRAERDQKLGKAHDLDLERAKIDIKRAQLVKTLAEERELGLEQALRMATETDLPRDVVAEANVLRRRLRSLGEVNLGAEEALQSLLARRAELVEQRDDLLDAKRKLTEAMKEIETATKDRFVTTFESVQSHFSALFAQLFEGGEASMSLSDPSDVMASGIDITVQLPGKRRQRMELLSGGERSLTALAFVFSLLSVRPSPLCILDEADAALDGRNVERFCSLLAEFSNRMQFLVVTHNAVTIENAHIWYGVTMQEPGVSTVIPFGKGAKAVVEAAV